MNAQIFEHERLCRHIDRFTDIADNRLTISDPFIGTVTTMQVIAELPEVGRPELDEAVFARLADDLRERAYSVIPGALPPLMLQALWQQVREDVTDEYEQAGVGRQSDHQLNPFVRRDRIRWINGAGPAEQQWLEWAGRLRRALNQQLLLGLFSFESHFAHYAPGAFYRKHLDSFRETGTGAVPTVSQRVLSVVAYLNPGWGPHDGGELVIYDPGDESTVQTVTPVAGTLVAFLSAEIPHEVLLARRDRYSIAGWYRVNGSHAARVDPPR